jgi:hypothetical protein
MSRHNLQTIDANHQIVVGWDPPLGNFFLQVIDPLRDEENEILVWLGADGIGTEANVNRILREASKWAMVPENLRKVLLAEQAANPENTPEFVREFIQKNKRIREI